MNVKQPMSTSASLVTDSKATEYASSTAQCALLRVSWVAVAVLAGFLCQSAVAARSVVVASWNLEVLSENLWFEAQPGIGVSRNRSDLSAMARFLDVRRPDIVLMQELTGPNTASAVFGNQTYDWYVAQNIGASPVLTPSTGLRTGIGVRRNANLSVKGVTEVPGSAFAYDGGSTRAAQAMDIEVDGTAITLVNVHLKAGCPTPIQRESFRKSRSRTCITLRKQTDALAAWIKIQVDQQKTLLVAGDFNRYLQAEYGVVLGTKQGERDAVLETLFPSGQNIRVLPAFTKTTCESRTAANAAFLDYFLLAGTDNHVVISKFFEYPYPDGERLSGIVFSNHCYVTVTLTVN